MQLQQCLHFLVLPLLPLPVCNLCSYHTGIKGKPANQKPEWLHASHVVFVLNCLPCISKILTQVQSAYFTTLFTMSEEWSKYAKILERKDKVFKRAMQEEISITSVLFYSSLNLTANNRVLAGAGIIAQHEKDLSIFKQCLALMLCMLPNFTST